MSDLRSATSAVILSAWILRDARTSAVAPRKAVHAAVDAVYGYGVSQLGGGVNDGTGGCVRLVGKAFNLGEDCLRPLLGTPGIYQGQSTPGFRAGGILDFL